MFWTRVFFLLVCVTLSFAKGVAQAPPQLNTLRAEGYEALYNLDYEGARRRFQKMIELAPDHPAGPQCFAASLWIQQLNESWELKSTLYSDKAYKNETTALASSGRISRDLTYLG